MVQFRKSLIRVVVFLWFISFFMKNIGFYYINKILYDVLMRSHTYEYLLETPAMRIFTNASE